LGGFVVNSKSNPPFVFAVGGSTIKSHMKPKKLSKRIRRLEARLQKGAKKLAKLKQKFEVGATAGADKTKGKLVARAGTAGVKEPSVAKRAKRKLNLTPERRAQLAATMKARWAAKRAAANPQNTSADPGSTPGDLSQPR
jgi:hypothetical protein